MVLSRLEKMQGEAVRQLVWDKSTSHYLVSLTAKKRGKYFPPTNEFSMKETQRVHLKPFSFFTFSLIELVPRMIKVRDPSLNNGWL